MKKKMLIISVILVALLSATFGSYEFLKDIGKKTTITRDDISKMFESDFQMMVYREAQIKDWNNKIITTKGNAIEFDDKIQQGFIDYGDDVNYRLTFDPLFVYWVVDPNTNEVINTNTQKQIATVRDNNQYYGEVAFNEKGEASLSEDARLFNFEDTQTVRNRIYNHSYIEDFVNNDGEVRSNIVVNSPKNFKIIMAIDASDTEKSALILDLELRTRGSEETLTVAYIMGVATLGLFILMLLMPYETVGEIEPYKTNRRFYLEVIGIAYTGLFLLLGAGINILVVRAVYNHAYIINEGADASLFIGILFGFYFLVTLFTDRFKSLFKNGFWNSLKHNTMTGFILKKIRSGFNKLIRVPMESKAYRKIILLVALVGIVLCIFAQLGTFGFVLSVFLMFAVLYYVGKEFRRILTEYSNTLGVVKEIAKGEFRDISDIDQYGTFRTLNKELLTIQNGFEEAVEKERKAQTMRTDLITNVSHDLKTPITGIQNYVELLEDDVNPEELSEYIHQIKYYTQRLDVLIQDVFDLSEVSSGTLKLDYQDVNMVSLLQQAQVEFSTQFEEKELKIVWNIDDKENADSVMLLDADRTYRIFENLFSNIVKYAMKHTRVYVDVILANDSIEVILKNTSQDIISLDQNQLKERFVRGESSRNVQGNGLGLSIAQSLVLAQKGDFNIVIDGDLFKVHLKFNR